MRPIGLTSCGPRSGWAHRVSGPPGWHIEKMYLDLYFAVLWGVVLRLLFANSSFLSTLSLLSAAPPPSPRFHSSTNLLPSSLCFPPVLPFHFSILPSSPSSSHSSVLLFRPLPPVSQLLSRPLVPSLSSVSSLSSLSTRFHLRFSTLWQSGHQRSEQQCGNESRVEKCWNNWWNK